MVHYLYQTLEHKFFCFFSQAEEYVPLPKGDVHKKKEIVQDVTLHDLDVANARPQVCKNHGVDSFSLLLADLTPPIDLHLDT